MHGDRDGRLSSSPPQSMLTDETNNNEKVNESTTSASSSITPTASSASSLSASAEQAYLSVGCSVSAKYRGAFCSALVKTIEKQVKLKVTLLDSGDTITISEEQIVHPVPLRIGATVTVRLTPSSRRTSNDSNYNAHHHHLSRSGLAAMIASGNTNHDEKQATIKQIIDNSIYTVVFNDGDEKSLRRSSLCVQGIRLYQTPYAQQQKIPEEIPTTPPTIIVPSVPSPPPTDTTANNANDITSIVGVRRGGTEQHAFPALILKRKALADYMWVKSFLDGREYIVHVRDDVQSYQNNTEIQVLCRTTSKQATQACDKFIKYNHVPAVWQKKKKKRKTVKTSKSNKDDGQSEAGNSSDNSTSESDDDDEDEDEDESDEETTEERDSFVAQLFAFMDDRGTPINNIPKVHNYDLDLHRLFKIVRQLGGYNKVNKNDQWRYVYIKMGLPGESSTESGRSIEHAYKKYLFAYEDLSKKLGSMNAPSTYLGGRTSMGGESRRSLMRARQQQNEHLEEEKKQKKTKLISKPKAAAAVKQRARKSNESRASIDSKHVSPPAKKQQQHDKITKTSTGPGRKPTISNKMKASAILSSSTSSSSSSESETTDDESSISSSASSSSNFNDENDTKKKAPIKDSTTTTKKQQTTPSISTIPKKITTTVTPAAKADVKKGPSVTATNKVVPPSKPTATSETAKSKSAPVSVINSSKLKTASTPTGSAPVQSASVKKPGPVPSGNDDKKKPTGPIGSKAVVSKNATSDTKTSSTSTPSVKKPVGPSTVSSKTPQSSKVVPQQKQSSSGMVKTTATTTTKPTPTNLPFKPKTTSTQSSASSSKERSLSKPTSSSSVDARPLKSTKTTVPSSKSVSQDRSTSASSSSSTKKNPNNAKPTATSSESSTPLTKPAPPSTKIPFSSSRIASLGEIPKKSSNTMDKFPKKQISKESTPKVSKLTESLPLMKATPDPQGAKHRSPSPASSTIPLSSHEPIKKVLLRDLTPLPITPASPSPPPALSSISSISDEPITPTIQSVLFSNMQSVSYQCDLEHITPDVKPPETPLVFLSTTNNNKSINECENVNSNKRSHPDENIESGIGGTSLSDMSLIIDDNNPPLQASPFKRVRRSISSQESGETFSSGEQPSTILSSSAIETMLTNRPSNNNNSRLTYDEIVPNDILLVSWGINGIKQYHARCIEKNDKKEELLVHYKGWNSRHDEWIKLDRVIERKDMLNSSTGSSSQRVGQNMMMTPSSREKHLDSTNSSIGGPGSNEQPSQQQPIFTSMIIDISSSSTLLGGDEDEDKHQTSASIHTGQKKDDDDDDMAINGSHSVTSLVTTNDGESDKLMIEEELDEYTTNGDPNERWCGLERISSNEDDAESCSSTIRTTESNNPDINTGRIISTEDTKNLRPSNNNEGGSSLNNREFESAEENEREDNDNDHHLQQTVSKRRQSRATSSVSKTEVTSVKLEIADDISSSSTISTNIIDILTHPYPLPMHVKEENIDVEQSSQITRRPSTPRAQLSSSIEPTITSLASPPAPATSNRRASARQQKRRTLREPNSSNNPSMSAKKKTKLDSGFGLATDFAGNRTLNRANSNTDSIAGGDHSTATLISGSNFNEQLSGENTAAKRYRPTGRRGGKRFANQQENDNDDFRSSSPSNSTMRQQLEEMFKNRPSRYNFLDLDNNLIGEERLTHLKDRMRECQKVFFNLKSALAKIEKQRKVYLRRNRPLPTPTITTTTTTMTIVQTTTTELLLPPTCT